MKTDFGRFAAAAACALLAPLALGGCVPGVIPAIRSAMRGARQPSSGGSSQSLSAAEQSLQGLGARAYRAKLRQVPLPTPSRDQVVQLKAAQTEAAQWATQILSGANKPLNNGPGIVIGEPSSSGEPSSVAKSQSSSTRSAALDDFGAGCARWLQLTVGGQGELGKTPLWGSIADARDDLHRTDCRWIKADAPRVAQSTAATHVAVGTITGTSANCVLSYQMWDARSKAIGAPIVIKGTREKIVAQLPQMAQMLSTRLLSSTRLAAPAPQVSADDLQFLGSVPWKTTDQLLPEQEVRLRGLSKKTPLAGILWIYNAARDSDETTLWRAVTKQVASQAPRNTLALATLACRATNRFAPYTPLLAAARLKFPGNYALLAAQWSELRSAGKPAACTKTALREVAASPASSLAWSELADSYADEAQAVRNGKYYGQMTSREQARVASFYPNQMMAGLKGTLVDPRAGGAWFQACEGAAFDGQSEIADATYWKSLALSQANHDVYWWGLQLYQPKWQGDSVKLHQVALALSRHTILYSQMMDDIYWAFHESDHSEGQLHTMAADCIQSLQAEVKLQPRQVAFHRELCWMFKKKSQFQNAAREYAIWMKLQPDSIIPATNLANLYLSSLHDPVNAEKTYRQAVAIDPQNSVTATNLADFYKDTKRDFDRAAPFYLRAMKADPQNVKPVTGLANIYWFLKNDEKTGGKLFVRATQMRDNNGAANAEYAWALMRHDQRDQAVVQANKAIALDFTDHPVFKALGLNSQ